MIAAPPSLRHPITTRLSVMTYRCVTITKFSPKRATVFASNSSHVRHTAKSYYIGTLKEFVSPNQFLICCRVSTISTLFVLLPSLLSLETPHTDGSSCVTLATYASQSLVLHPSIGKSGFAICRDGLARGPVAFCRCVDANHSHAKSTAP